MPLFSHTSTVATYGVGKFGQTNYAVEFGTTLVGGWYFEIFDAFGGHVAEQNVAGPVNIGQKYKVRTIFIDNGDGTMRIIGSVDNVAGVDAVTGLQYSDVDVIETWQIASAIRYGSLYVALIHDNKFDNILFGSMGQGSSDLLNYDFTSGTVIPPFDAYLKNGSSIPPGTDCTIDGGQLRVHPSILCDSYVQKNF